MKNPDTDELIASALKGKLSPQEQREFERLLRDDLLFRGAWQAEKALEKALGALPDAPVSSNFTSRVVQAALRGERVVEPRRPWFRFFLPKLAAGLAATAVIALTLHQQHQKAQVREAAATVSDFNKVALAIGTENAPEVFSNFDAIQRLNLPAESELDMELLAALQ